MLQHRYVRRSTREIGDLFGRAFALQLAELPAQEAWQGPLRSAFGWHAIQLTERQAATSLSFELQNLLASYEIQLPPGEASTATP